MLVVMVITVVLVLAVLMAVIVVTGMVRNGYSFKNLTFHSPMESASFFWQMTRPIPLHKVSLSWN